MLYLKKAKQQEKDVEFYTEFLMNVGLFAHTSEEEASFRAGVDLVLKYLDRTDIKKQLLNLECFESDETYRRPRARNKVISLVGEFVSA